MPSPGPQAEPAGGKPGRRARLRPLLRVGVFYALGAAVAVELGELGRAPTACLLGASAVVLGLVFLRPRARFSSAGSAVAALALGVVGLGVERSEYESVPLRSWVRVQEAAGDDALCLTGTLAADPDESAERWVLLLDVESVGIDQSVSLVAGRARLLVDGSAPRPTLVQGDRIKAWARVGLPRGFGNPGSFDSEAYAFQRGIHAMGFVKSPALVSRLGWGRIDWLRGAASRLRQAAREKLALWTRPGAASGVVRAMVLGDRAGLAPDTEEAFRIAGTYHVLALSGAQVALVVALLLWPLRRLGLSPLATAVVAGAGVLFYATFVGGETPVLRAAVMALVLLFGLAWGFEGDAANLLGLAALVLLAHRPSGARDVAFQLSFVATLAVITLVPVLTPLVKRLPKSVGLLVAASLAAQIGVTPLLALHFHRLAPAALVLNLAAVPLASVVLVAGFALVLTAGWAPPLAWLSALVAERSAALMLRSGQLVWLAPWLDVRVPTPGMALLLLYGAAAVTLAREGRLRTAPALLLAAALVGLVLGTGPPPGDGRLALTVLDVGDGDSLVLRSPRGRVLLVDAGGLRSPSLDVGEAVTGAYLWQLGLRRIDRLVLTHSHNDHVGGAPFMVSAFRPREVWEPPRPSGEALSPAVAASARKAGVPRRTVCRGMRGLWDEVSIEVLWPPCEQPGGNQSENDGSIVLRLRFGRAAFLLAGDVGATAEGALGPGRADVVKIPHHGSRSSSSEAFVAEARPQLAIVSCGRKRTGDRGLAGVLERYRHRGARVVRTDSSGAVTVATDGRRLWIDTFR